MILYYRTTLTSQSAQCVWGTRSTQGIEAARSTLSAFVRISGAVRWRASSAM